MTNLENTAKDVLINEGKSVIIYNDDTKKNPKDPMIQVSNYGSMFLSQLQRMISRDVKSLSKYADKPSALLSEMGKLQDKAEALRDIEDEMASSQFKKKIR
jgi:hypothetical protein